MSYGIIEIPKEKEVNYCQFAVYQRKRERDMVGDWEINPWELGGENLFGKVLPQSCVDSFF